MSVFNEEGYKGSFLFTPFLNRYAPYFNAYSFPLARANEYEADAASVTATSKGAAAEALTAVHVVSSYLNEQYWPQIYRKADDMPQPAFAPYQEMHGHLVGDVPHEKLDRWLEQAMKEETGLSDTHPSLKDRLAAFGETPRFAPPRQGDSAEKLLGSAEVRQVFKLSKGAVVQGNDSRLQEATINSYGIVKLCPDNVYSENSVVTGNDPRIRRATIADFGICRLAENGEISAT